MSPRRSVTGGSELGVEAMADLERPVVMSSQLLRRLVMDHPDTKPKPETVSDAWRLCNEFFAEYLDQGSGHRDKERAALHLASYLASWGMMRGSSFLTGYNFKIHEGAIDILAEAPSCLRTDMRAPDSDCLEAAITSTRLRLEGHYRDSNFKERQPTHTLTSKILLGVFGCCVGYDRYVVGGLRELNLPGTFREKGVKALHQWTQEFSQDLCAVQLELRDSHINYPLMKLVDMCLWQLGKEIA